METKTKAAVKAKKPNDVIELQTQIINLEGQCEVWDALYRKRGARIAELEAENDELVARNAVCMALIDDRGKCLDALHRENDELVKDKARLCVEVERQSMYLADIEGSRKSWRDKYEADARPWYSRLYRWAVKMWEGM